MVEDAKPGFKNFPSFYAILHHFQITVVGHLAVFVSSYNLNHIFRETVRPFDLYRQAIGVAEFNFASDCSILR